MKKTTLLSSCVIVLAGYFTGWLSHKIASGSADDRLSNGSDPVSSDGESSLTHSSGKLSKRDTAAHYSKLRSADTLETLRQLPVNSPDLYRRLSLWLLDASKEDIAAYWQTFSKNKKIPDDIAEVIFIHWARFSPTDAIQASEGSPYSHFAWRAWACKDPKSAMEAAKVTDDSVAKKIIEAAKLTGEKTIFLPKRESESDVAAAIGEFHSQWLIDHIEELPVTWRASALGYALNRGARDEPLKMLESLRSMGALDYRAGLSLIKSSAAQDSKFTFDWISKNEDLLIGGKRMAMEALLESVALQGDDALRELAAKLPDESLRREIESIQFDQLVEKDIHAALENADQTQSPNIALGKFTSVGLKLAESAPDQSFEILKKITTLDPSLSSQSTMALCATLMEIDPARVVSIQLESAKAQPNGTLDIGNIPSAPARIWADNDPDSYAAWLGKQTDEKLKSSGAEILTRSLESNDRFEEAILWQMNQNREGISSVYGRWYLNNPESATAWKKQANLSPSELRECEGDERDMQKISNGE